MSGSSPPGGGKQAPGPAKSGGLEWSKVKGNMDPLSFLMSHPTPSPAGGSESSSWSPKSPWGGGKGVSAATSASDPEALELSAGDEDGVPGDDTASETEGSSPNTAGNRSSARGFNPLSGLLPSAATNMWSSSPATSPPPATKASAASSSSTSAYVPPPPAPIEHSQSPESPMISPDDFPLLSGESRLAHLPNLCLQTPHGILIRGQFVITSFRVIFVPYMWPLPPALVHLPSDYFTIPVNAVDRIERENIPKKQGSASRDVVMHSLLLFIKDGRVLRIAVPDSGAGAEISADRIFSLIDAYAFPENISRHLFCFSHYKALLQANSPLGKAGWGVYDIEAEFERQFSRKQSGTSWLSSASCPWRLSSINERYATSHTYPRLLMVPKGVSDAELVASAGFRAEARLPCLTWGSPDSSASIWRASQPKVGVAGASSAEDEKLLRLIGAGELGLKEDWCSSIMPSDASKGLGLLRIFDLRPKTAALANRATGYGYESSANYPTSSICFMNIQNIHAMRDSMLKLLALVHSTAVQDVEWLTLVESTKWLLHIRLQLNAAYRIAHAVHRDKAAVFLHCSHGWDRTALVSALAQLMLDPYYRTFRGFMVLVEKDWLSFGHPFQLRTAHGQKSGNRIEDQLAPIFLQFLDCVWQVLQQHPNLFEFNGRYLLCIAHNFYNCRFGTFLCNTEKERSQLMEDVPYPSIWAYLDHLRDELINPLYGTGHGKNPMRILDSPLPSLLRRVRLWDDYFLRFSARPCHPTDSYARMRRFERSSRLPESDADTALPWLTDERLDDDMMASYLEASKEAESWRRKQLERLLKEEEAVGTNGGKGEGEGEDEEQDLRKVLEKEREEVARLREIVKRQAEIIAALPATAPRSAPRTSSADDALMNPRASIEEGFLGVDAMLDAS